MRWAAGILLLFAACSSGKLTFEAKVADLRKPGNHFASRKEPEDAVQVTVPGKMLDPALALERVNRAQADWSTPEHAVGSVISANTAGDLPWIVQNYVPEERPEAGKQLSDPMAAARTRAFYLNLGLVKLIGCADIDGRRIMFLRGDDADGDFSIATVVLANTGEGWRQTISLNRDDRYDVVTAALHHSGVR
jgi:hypothetical protein